MSLRFATPASAAEPRDAYEAEPPARSENPESDLWRVVDASAQKLDHIGHRIDRGQSRAGAAYRVTPAEIARLRTLFSDGLAAVATYESRRAA